MSEEVKNVCTSDAGEDDGVEVEELEDVTMVEDIKPSDVASKLMKNPTFVAALQSKLGSMIGTQSDYIASLPKSVKRRIKSLKKLQFEATKAEAMFFQEVHQLECKYWKMYQPLYEKRFQITSGNYEPNDEESDWPSDEEKDDEELAGDAKEKLKIEDDKSDDSFVGIPEFWLTIFKNVETLADMVQKHDEPLLKHLKDVKVKILESNPMGFCLEFHFEPNDYINNSVLTKEYEMRCSPDETDPFSFDGPEIIKCKGCEIDWKKGKNITVKTIKKKQKHKSKGSVRTITKTVQIDSFFNFFEPPPIPDDEDAEVDEDVQALLASDFEIGHYIRERIVPRAVLYFTGEALEDEMDDDDDEGDDDDDDESDGDDYNNVYHEDEDADYGPNVVKKGKVAGKNKSPNVSHNSTYPSTKVPFSK